MTLLILVAVTIFLFGMAAGAWLLAWIGRRVDRNSAAVIREMQEQAERAGYDRGYASALGVRSTIDEPADHERSPR
jgi:hypothetical protein